MDQRWGLAIRERSLHVWDRWVRAGLSREETMRSMSSSGMVVRRGVEGLGMVFDG